jgi:hypothetical protein
MNQNIGLLTIQEVNAELANLAAFERDTQTDNLFEELMEDNELLRQHEAMSYSQQLEDFSPFDTFNS